MIRRAVNVLISVRRNVHKGAGEKKYPFDGDSVLVPDEPYNSTIDSSLLSPTPQFDSKLISHLESLSLVHFDSEQAVANLRKSVQIAQRLELVNTENVEPMDRVWEDQECPVFDDIEEPSLDIEEVFRNAAVRYDDYFSTPPGNVPLESKERFDLNMINEWDTIGKPTAPEVKTTKMVENSKK